MIKLILVLVISYISLSNACSCYLPPGWQKEFYCRYTFAGTFRVLGPSYDCGEMTICYPIVVVDRIRGNPVTITYAQTASQSAACGTTLIPGHTYFVATAPGDDHNIGVGLCMLLEDWTDLSCSELRKKRNEYKQIKCGDEPTEPTEPECDRSSGILRNILESLLKLLKSIKLRSGNCDCGRH